MPFPDYLRAAVLEPLGLDATLDGDAAGGIVGTLGDMLAFGQEAPRAHLDRARDACRGDGPFSFPASTASCRASAARTPNDWGLGFELRDGKEPHWTGSRNSASTYGHFGSKPGTATFVWVDPERQLVAATVADISFGEWAAAAWPALSDALLEEVQQ
jgi:CubicO group peptidase (beta-lactamase class C family)